jgi:hypothetical protein
MGISDADAGNIGDEIVWSAGGHEVTLETGWLVSTALH